MSNFWGAHQDGGRRNLFSGKEKFHFPLHHLPLLGTMRLKKRRFSVSEKNGFTLYGKRDVFSFCYFLLKFKILRPESTRAMVEPDFCSRSHISGAFQQTSLDIEHLTVGVVKQSPVSGFAHRCIPNGSVNMGFTQQTVRFWGAVSERYEFFLGREKLLLYGKN